jgi:hypothetical protein
LRNYNFSVIAISLHNLSSIYTFNSVTFNTKKRYHLSALCKPGHNTIWCTRAIYYSALCTCSHMKFPRVRPEIKYSPLSVVCICYTSISWLFLLLHLSENFTILSSSLSLSLSLYISLSLFLSYYLSLSLHIWGSSMWPLHS